MPRLNDQFTEALIGADGRLKVVPDGYVVVEHEQDGLSVEVDLDPWMSPRIFVRGILHAAVLKGGIAYDEESASFEEGGLFQEGLHMDVEDASGDRRYWISDTDQEEVLVSFWDPNAESQHPTDGITLGRYGDYSPAPQEDATRVKETVKAVIDAGSVAIISQLGS